MFESLQSSQLFFQNLISGHSLTEQVILASLFIGLSNGLFIPVNVGLLLTALLLPSWPAFIAGMIGALVAGLIGYAYGLFLDQGILRRKLGARYEIITSEISREGFKTILLLHLAPITPNILANALAGICRMPLWKFTLGTLLGFLPGVAVMTLLGQELKAIAQKPGYQALIGLAGIAALLWLSYKIGKRLQKRFEKLEAPL